MFQFKEYFTSNSKLSPDSCDQCAGYCFTDQSGNSNMIDNSKKCISQYGSNSQSTISQLFPKISNSYITISPQTNSNYYLDFLSQGIAQNSSVFLRQQSFEQPMRWILEPVDNYTVYIRTYDLPYYYLYANQDGSIGVSLFRGNDNQKWLILAGYSIISAKYCAFLFTNGSDVSLTKDAITFWNIQIA